MFLLMKKPYQWVMFPIAALGHPIILYSYLFLLHPFLERFGFKALKEVGARSFQIDFLLFGVCALLIYYILMRLLLLIFKRIKGFNAVSFVRSQLLCDLFVGLPGLFHLYFWITGMDGNAFIFLFYLPMLISINVSFFILIIQITRAVCGSFSESSD